MLHHPDENCLHMCSEAKKQLQPELSLGFLLIILIMPGHKSMNHIDFQRSLNADSNI